MVHRRGARGGTRRRPRAARRPLVRRRALAGVRRYRSLASLQRDQARCRACVDAGHPLGSLPVLAPLYGQRAYLFGQAPGIVEGEERRPWRGRAGRTLRRWLELDEETFYETFYCASVTRCYPGRAASGRGDRTPTREEQDLCAGWHREELRLLQPRLIVTVGGLAARSAARRAERHRVGRPPLPARRSGRDPPATSVRCEQLVERPAESPASRRGGPARARRA